MPLKKLFLLFMALGLSGCAHDIARRTETPPQAIGRAAGDGVQQIVGRFDTGWSLFNRNLDGKAVSLMSVVRAANVGGKTHVCAAMIVAGDDETLAEIDRLVGSHKIKLFLGAAPRPYSPYESLPYTAVKMHPVRAPAGLSASQMASLLPVEANCGTTELEWNPAFAGGHRLFVNRTR